MKNNSNHGGKFYFFSGMLTITPEQSPIMAPDQKKLMPINQIINGVIPADEDELFNPANVEKIINVQSSIPSTVSFMVQNFFVISQRQADKITRKN